VPALPKSTSSGCAAMTRMRLISVSSSTLTILRPAGGGAISRADAVKWLTPTRSL
jgi:hypothetical protein